MRTDTDTLTDANRFYDLSHAICNSYGTDKEDQRNFGQEQPSALFFIVDFIYCTFSVSNEINSRETGGSKIEAKCRTFSPRKIRKGMGETSGSIIRV